MNISDKKYIEFNEQIWDRNKELISENRKLKSEIDSLKKEIFKLKEELKETNKCFNDICEENYEYIKELEEENHDLALVNDTLVEELKEYSKKYENDGQLSNKEVNEMLVDLSGVLAGYPCSDLKITFNL